jgi:hypothetical protein
MSMLMPMVVSLMRVASTFMVVVMVTMFPMLVVLVFVSLPLTFMVLFLMAAVFPMLMRVSVTVSVAVIVTMLPFSCCRRQLATIFNHNGLQRLVILVRTGALDLANDGHTLNHAAKHHVLAV